MEILVSNRNRRKKILTGRAPDGWHQRSSLSRIGRKNQFLIGAVWSIGENDFDSGQFSNREHNLDKITYFSYFKDLSGLATTSKDCTNRIFRPSLDRGLH